MKAINPYTSTQQVSEEMGMNLPGYLMHPVSQDYYRFSEREEERADKEVSRLIEPTIDEETVTPNNNF